MQATQPLRRRQVVIGNRRVRTIDVHAHVVVPEATELLKDTPLARPAGGGGGAVARQAMSPERLEAMDAQGIDTQVLSINPFWYSADRDLAARLISLQNEKLVEICAARPDRFVPVASVALQHPDLAAQQLEEARTRHNMRGAAIGCSVEGAELSDPKFDPFWKKAQDLDALIFIHPQPGPPNARFRGNGVLNNVIGNPLETTIALSHLIFEGTLAASARPRRRGDRPRPARPCRRRTSRARRRPAVRADGGARQPGRERPRALRRRRGRAADPDLRRIRKGCQMAVEVKAPVHEGHPTVFVDAFTDGVLGRAARCSARSRTAATSSSTPRPAAGGR